MIIEIETRDKWRPDVARAKILSILSLPAKVDVGQDLIQITTETVAEQREAEVKAYFEATDYGDLSEGDKAAILAEGQKFNALAERIRVSYDPEIAIPQMRDILQAIAEFLGIDA